jgi:Na+/proline symporter
MGKVCFFLFGWPTWTGLILFSSLCAVYVLAAGFWGVVMADFQQGIVAFVAIVFVSIWGIHAAGGPQTIVSKLAAMGETGKLNPFAFTGFTTGDFPAAWFITMIFIGVVGGFGMATAIDWFPEAQRIQSARTVKDASWSIWAGQALVVTRNAIWAAAILAFFTLYPDIAEVKDYEMAWFRLGFETLPAGMIGFFFAAIVAIHLSTISTHLNLGAVYITRDLYHHYVNPKADERRLVLVGRVGTLVLLLGSFVFGSIMENITEWLIFALWIMAAGVWLPGILQVVWWRFNGWGYLSAWVFNLVFSWLVVWVLPAFGVLPHLRDYQQFWLLMILGAAVFIPVTFATKPEDMDRLVKFYVMSRPVGWWGPVRREAERRELI